MASIASIRPVLAVSIRLPLSRMEHIWNLQERTQRDAAVTKLRVLRTKQMRPDRLQQTGTTLTSCIDSRAGLRSVRFDEERRSVFGGCRRENEEICAC